jgi:DNA-directed RNA polymerase subunit A"
LHLDAEKLSFYEITARSIASKLSKREDITADLEGNDIKIKAKKKDTIKSIRTTFVHVLSSAIMGIPGINKALIQQDDDGTFYITTGGSNMEEVMKIDGVEKWNIYSNDQFEVARIYGIEAARNLLANELLATIKDEGITVSFRHIGLLADAMTYTGEIRSAGRHGIAGDKDSVLARAAYEETVKHFINAGVFGERDQLKGVAENILIGKQIGLGTGRIRLTVKKEDIKKLK